MNGTFLLEHAWLGRDHGVADNVLVTVADGRFTAVETGVTSLPMGTIRFPGLTVPGLANCHSHTFHRALRARVQRGTGSFWTWREQMYAVAARLDPDSYRALAKATFREMLLAGFTSVGEFHYLHHGPDGTPYDDPNAMGLAVVEAAGDAGIRICVLDACYLTSAIGAQPEGVQVRFSDGDAEAWAERAEDLRPAAGKGVVVGAAIHSVRAVPRDQMRYVTDWARARVVPLHFHLSEQVAENRACMKAYDETPTGVLEEGGALGELSTAVHATHLTDADVAMLGETRTHACLCPTTERDLGDGIGPARLLHEAGARLTVGSDSQAVVDPFEEMRAVELGERLSAQARGHFSADELLAAGTAHASLGFPDVGRIAVGAQADLVTLDLSSPRTAGAEASPEAAVFAATAADVVQVIVAGSLVASRDDAAEVAAELEAAVGALR